MASERRRPETKADDDAWKRLGLLLQLRRADLGYRRRPGFTKDRNINIRLVTDIENAYRNTFLTPTLGQIAQAYQVTYESLAAVLSGTADELTPVAPSAPPAPAGSVGNDGLPPTTDAAGIAAARPYADQIWMRLLDVAAQGVTDPYGAVVFGEGTDEARIWDVPSLRQLCSVPERVWMIAGLRHRAAGPAVPS